MNPSPQINNTDNAQGMNVAETSKYLQSKNKIS